MILTNRQLFDLGVAKSLYLERVKTGRVMLAQAELRRYIARLIRDLGPTILALETSSYSAANALVTEFRKWDRVAGAAMLAAIMALLDETLDTEIELSRVVWGLDLPKREQLEAVVFDRPIGETGLTVRQMADKWRASVSVGIIGVIQSGATFQRTPKEILDLIKSQVTAKSGALNSVVRTGVQSAANRAFSSRVEWYRWVSILDSRTSDICRSLAHKVFQRGKGPLPPMHPRCRSSVVPHDPNGDDFDEPTLEGWLSEQSTGDLKSLTSESPLTLDQYRNQVKKWHSKHD
ncbi:minor capsid component [Caudoviricetes sp.]|nr:minor capsid component [Caudoviricetes sp.]